MNDARTVWVGNISDQVTEELLYELFLQAGPLEKAKIPTDREGRKSNFGFITFKHEVSVPYSVQLLNGIRMFEKNLNIKPRSVGTQRDKPQNMQRSFSYPNEGFQQNQHTRFDERHNMGPQHVSYEDLLTMGQMVNLNYNYLENSFGNEHDGHFDKYQDERHGTGRERDRDIETQNYDKPNNDYGRDRGRHRDYSHNRNQRRNHDKRSYNRNRGRKNHHYS